jgi:membrane-associated protein
MGGFGPKVGDFGPDDEIVNRFLEPVTIINMFHFDIESLIQSGGILLVAAIVFAESGLLIGFFLPGDTLLLSAGVFAAQGKLPLELLIPAIVVAAVLGDNVGYSIGRRMGKRIFKKKDSLFFHRENVEKAEKFYEEHGGKTIVLARFVPIVRTFAPVVAGVSKMPRKRFMFFNVFGGLFWGAGVTLLGYFVGGKIPDVDKYIMPTIAAVTILTFGPAFYHLFKEKENRQRLAEKAKLALRNIFLNKKVD